MENLIVDTKVMSRGQITLPKEIRTKLGINTGDRVTLICEGEQVILMNPAVYAMKMLQIGMLREAEQVGLEIDEDVIDLVKEVRDEMEKDLWK